MAELQKRRRAGRMRDEFRAVLVLLSELLKLGKVDEALTAIEKILADRR